ncbi:Osmosensitive K+ channel histidine kinase-like protein [Nostocoides japonicum T1-X7]|uniref:Osmosensitive K+ channel histidine kinase-like protein n=1 Tax=Nostocoides japonicum T1-X7 TaxID=1194083 RepID=A0A077M0Q5_9MICO|nr:DUF4118 domain-containing protein [Tetrasphaera japonica]CCH78662.1 Osmosensitive K+ channel histidine kinase-like protein [Tetrasphaera japonica T1-X7]
MRSSTSPSRPALVGIALGAPVVVAWLLSLVRGDVEPTNAALVLVLLVVALAATGDRVAGIVTALSSTVWFDFFLTAPYRTFTISSRDDVETAVLLVVVGLAVTELALWGRRQQGGSSRREGYLAGIVSAARLAATGATSARDVTDQVGRQIAGVLGAAECRFERGPGSGNRPLLDPDGRVVGPDGHEVDVERSGLPTMDFLEVPVASNGEVLGRFLVSAADRIARPDRERRRVALTLADQAGAVLVHHPDHAG